MISSKYLMWLQSSIVLVNHEALLLNKLCNTSCKFSKNNKLKLLVHMLVFKIICPNIWPNYADEQITEVHGGYIRPPGASLRVKLPVACTQESKTLHQLLELHHPDVIPHTRDPPCVHLLQLANDVSNHNLYRHRGNPYKSVCF